MADDRQGHAGEPGLPGEPGAGAGGRGGHGGAGGRGGTVKPIEHYKLLIFFVIVTVALSITTIILVVRVEANNDRIARLERDDVTSLKAADAARDAISTALTKANAQQDAAITLIRQTDYRLCVRGQVTRVALNIDRAHDEPTLPLYDCTPDLKGGQARRLTAAQARVLADRVRRNNFKP
jgi:Tfp pilus assembly protein PilX